MPSGGSKGGDVESNKIYKKRLPEEQESLDLSSGILKGLLEQGGYELKTTGGRLSQIEEELTRLRGGGGTGVEGLEGGNFAMPAAEGEDDNDGFIISGSKHKKGKKGDKGLGADVQAQIKELEKERKQLMKEGGGGSVYTLDKRAPTVEEQKEKQFESELKTYTQDTLTQGLKGEVPTAVREQLNTIYGEQRRQAQEQLKQFGTEMAASRGLNVTDTPIGDPLLRGYADIESQLGAAQAGSLIQARSDEIARAQALREFQANFDQLRNFTNPMNLSNAAQNLALGLYQPRFRVAATGQSTTGGSMLAGVGGVLGGLGSLSGSLFPQGLGGGNTQQQPPPTSTTSAGGGGGGSQGGSASGGGNNWGWLGTIFGGGNG